MTIDRRGVMALGMLAAAALVGFHPPSQAQDSRPGRVATRAFAPLPSPLVVELRVLDNSAENLRLLEEFRSRLARAGHRVVASGAKLRFDIESEVRPLAAGPPRGPRGAPERPGGAAIPEQRGRDALPADPVLRRPERAPTPSGRALRYVVNVTIDDAATGRRLWQGNVRYDDAEPDRERMLVRLVPELLRELGKTVQTRRFTLE